MDTIGIKFAHYGEERDLNLNDEEKALVQSVFELICNDVDLSKLDVVRKSDSYVTIVIRGEEYDSDLIRFKYTERAKWISIFLSNEDRKKYEDSPMFAAQKKKSQLHWKSKINSLEDLQGYKALIVNAYNGLRR